MITIAVTKSDLIRLLSGVYISQPIFLKCRGKMLIDTVSGDIGTPWRWDTGALQQMTEDELYQLYSEIKNTI